MRLLTQPEAPATATEECSDCGGPMTPQVHGRKSPRCQDCRDLLAAKRATGSARRQARDALAPVKEVPIWRKCLAEGCEHKMLTVKAVRMCNKSKGRMA